LDSRIIKALVSTRFFYEHASNYAGLWVDYQAKDAGPLVSATPLGIRILGWWMLDGKGHPWRRLPGLADYCLSANRRSRTPLRVQPWGNNKKKKKNESDH
jgi:hypothetical protein